MTDPLAAAVSTLAVASWVGRATVTRPTGPIGWDDDLRQDTTPTTTVTTGMRCALLVERGQRQVDVAGDTATYTRFRLEHDPDVELRVDDRVTFTTHPDVTVQGTEFVIVAVHAVDRATYGLASVQRQEDDRGT